MIKTQTFIINTIVNALYVIPTLVISADQYIGCLEKKLRYESNLS